MDLLIAANTVAYANRDVAPTTGTPGWATAGNPAAGIPATIDSAGQFNAFQEELTNVIKGAGITLDRTNNAQLLAAIRTIATGRLLGSLSFPGSANYSPSTAAVKQLKVWVTGGGGGGSDCKSNNISQGSTSGGGGGAGGTSVGLLQVAALTFPIAIGVGAGGAAQLSGGNSSFGNILVGAGGAGSSFQQGTVSAAGGVGGIAAGGIYNLIGGDGSDGQAAGFIFPGNGGGSYWGSGGRAGNQAGYPGRAYGAGGGGAYDSALSNTFYSGGAGAQGFVIVEEYT